MTDWSKSELQIIKWLGIDMWHQSLDLYVDNQRHDKAFASMIAKVKSESKPFSKIEAKSPPIISTDNKQPQSSTQKISELIPSFTKEVKTPTDLPNTHPKAIEAVEKFTLTPTTKYRFPEKQQWGEIENREAASGSSINQVAVFDNDEGALDLLVLHWASKSPGEAEFIEKFSANCFSSLATLGLNQVVSIAFSTNTVHQIEPNMANKRALLTAIHKIVESKSPAKILICGTALARLLLDSDCPLYKLRQHPFLFAEQQITTTVSIDFASIFRTPKLKSVLWQDLKYLAKS